MNHQTTIDAFYHDVVKQSKLPSTAHAARATSAVLRALGFNLSGNVKRKLAKALPEDLAKELKRGWRLINIRRNKLPLQDFLKDIALHSGNTDPQYAEFYTAAVFRAIKQQIDSGTSREVARDLSPEIRNFWNAA
jgi:uncharacterized protein (DUF2267 family)